MNFHVLNFFETHFPSLKLVQFSATQFQIWDRQKIIWATIKVEKNSKIFTLTNKVTDKVTDIFEVSEELNNAITEFYQTLNPLLEQAKKDYLARKKEIENEFRKGFSTQQKENLQPIIQLLEEGGHSLFLLSEWIAIFEFWKTIYQTANFKKSFFQRHEIFKSLTNFYNISHKNLSKGKIPASYSEIESFVTDFCQKNKIKEKEILLYGVLNQFLNQA
jgi:hypothetical protein